MKHLLFLLAFAFSGTAAAQVNYYYSGQYYPPAPFSAMSQLQFCKNPQRVSDYAGSSVIARGNGHPACPIENAVYVEEYLVSPSPSGPMNVSSRVTNYGGYASLDPMGFYDSQMNLHLLVVSSDDNIYHRTRDIFWHNLGGNILAFNQCQGQPMAEAQAYGHYSPSCLKFGFSMADKVVEFSGIYIATTTKDHTVRVRSLGGEWINFGGYATSTPIFQAYGSNGVARSRFLTPYVANSNIYSAWYLVVRSAPHAPYQDAYPMFATSIATDGVTVVPATGWQYQHSSSPLYSNPELAI